MRSWITNGYYWNWMQIAEFIFYWDENGIWNQLKIRLYTHIVLVKKEWYIIHFPLMIDFNFHNFFLYTSNSKWNLWISFELSQTLFSELFLSFNDHLMWIWHQTYIGAESYQMAAWASQDYQRVQKTAQDWQWVLKLPNDW